jgi:hypothetical protein
MFDNDINQMPDNQISVVNTHLNFVLVRWQRQFLQQQVLLFFPKYLAIVITVLFTLVNADFITVGNATIALLITSLLGGLAKFMLTRFSTGYLNITLGNLIAHFNDRFAVLENSAQLLLRDEHLLKPLEKLQYDKVLLRINDILQQQMQVGFLDISPKFAKYNFIMSIVLLTFLLLLFTFINVFQLFEKTNSWFQSNEHVINSAENKVETSVVDATIDIVSQQVNITPPSYSLAKNQASQRALESLDIDTLVGSEARWSFSFSQQDVDYFIIFSNGDRHQLHKQKDGTYHFQRKLNTSMVYHLAVANADVKVSKDFAKIHSIKLTPDKAPKIRFISPKNTVTEYGKNTTPNVVAEVHISDDFAVSSVNILASIAKGSGEGVKFRDQNFTFDRNTLVDGKMHYYKNWSLADLGMEPGDELYFSILASDNREPENQQTRSATKIVRWLEEEQSGISADGILIDFMPEYFKSQRQIIIETIELIEDRPDLGRAKFNEKSELLGVAQSALKEKYGQYLGDESEGPQNVGSSVGVTFDESHSTEEHSADEQKRPNVQVFDDHGGSNAVITSVDEQHDDSAGHQHAGDGVNNNGDISGRMEIINRYGHNHEDSDVGVMTSQDPKALMKKSLSNMWQAELHLMLSEPELALPFEQQAFKLLKLAKKAERIYVKRLGFEPPPVTEQRRYQGEQSDILVKSLQVSRFQPELLSDQSQLAFRKLLILLNQFSQPVDASLASKSDLVLSEENGENLIIPSRTASWQLTTDELTLIEIVKKAIEKQLDKRPALVAILAVIEQILLERQLVLSQCDNCIALLSGKIEQLIPNAISAPKGSRQDFYDQQPLVENYSQFLKDNL